ncbi:hypothetical protein BS50DRAFT_490618 [Corynespora cassiicola Philippines]|uniref:Uncharacterized protein n=1 Tax=Corynespora cassiicola Philippines TaxID=1448308 RepID=A0A2T2NTP4_CORCC|nr:hypothetical protein BS50DRAFT_490618 [Corynespora cassiicola Philippines]
MCSILYTIHSCNHWVPQPSPGNGPMLRICDHSDTNRMGVKCPEIKHEVANRSQGLCDGCLWKKVSK